MSENIEDPIDIERLRGRKRIIGSNNMGKSIGREHVIRNQLLVERIIQRESKYNFTIRIYLKLIRLRIYPQSPE